MPWLKRHSIDFSTLRLMFWSTAFGLWPWLTLTFVRLTPSSMRSHFIIIIFIERPVRRREKLHDKNFIATTEQTNKLYYGYWTTVLCSIVKYQHNKATNLCQLSTRASDSSCRSCRFPYNLSWYCWLTECLLLDNGGLLIFGDWVDECGLGYCGCVGAA